MVAASSSAWQWDSSHGLYYNAQTQVWAQPQPDGSWKYSNEGDKVPKGVDKEASVKGADETEEDVDGEELEEGQLEDDEQAGNSERNDSSGNPLPYDQVWPGSDSEDQEEDDLSRVPILRLLATSSAILKPPKTLVVVDPHNGISIGRDKAFDQRVRLKELEVSKSHATIFWMKEGLDGEIPDGGWAVVDNGSTHGTWITRNGSKVKERLSEPKKASRSKELLHLDTLKIGSTSFKIHLHPSFACTTCSIASDSSNLIPLQSLDEIPSKGTPEPANFTTKSKSDKEQDLRAKMRGLKDQLLAPSSATSSRNGSHGATKSQKRATTLSTSVNAMGLQVPGTVEGIPSNKPIFVDRAAARRARTGAAPTETVPPPPFPCPTPFFAVPGAGPASSKAGVPQIQPNPFSSDSKGAQLLSKLTQPSANGLGSGAQRKGLGKLVEARSFDPSAEGGRDHRPGLGSQKLVNVVERHAASATSMEGKRGWREEGKELNRKRFKELDSRS